MNIKMYGADWCSDCVVAKQFFDEKGIIETTRLKAESYFKSAREDLKKIKSIDTDELLKFTNLIEKRTF